MSDPAEEGARMTDTPPSTPPPNSDGTLETRFEDDPLTPDDALVSDDIRAAEAAEASRERRRWIVGVIVIIVLVILILLLLRGCGMERITKVEGGKEIVTIVPATRTEEVVSVWIRKGESIDAVLARAGVDSESTVDMGDGLYFVFGPRDAGAAVTRLRATPGVYDAGYAQQELLRRSDVETP